jgi:GntR family transcriptional regulator
VIPKSSLDRRSVTLAGYSPTAQPVRRGKRTYSRDLGQPEGASDLEVTQPGCLQASLAKAGLFDDDLLVWGSSAWPREGGSVSFGKKISTRTLYIQVRDHLAQQIARGALKPGSHLPSELELADQLGVSLGTLRKALEALENERLITRHQGRGTFVRDHAADARLTFDNLRTKDGQPIPFTVQFLSAASERASAEEQQRLGLETSELVARCQLVRHHEGPFLFERMSLAVSRFFGLDCAELRGPYQLAVLAQDHGVLVGSASETVEIARASAEVSALLVVDPGTPLLRLDRIIYSLDHVPLEWRLGYCKLTAVKYVSTLRN